MIPHARHNAQLEQTTFDLDMSLTYQCYNGYVTNGFPKAKCLSIDGKASWFGPDISCEREFFLLRSLLETFGFLIVFHSSLQPDPADRRWTFLTVGMLGNATRWDAEWLITAQRDTNWSVGLKDFVKPMGLGARENSLLACVS